MSIDPTMLGLMFLAGLLLGAGFYLGLWATVRRLPTARHPALLTLGSLVLRLGLLLAALYWLTALQPERMAAAVAGVILARLLLQRRLGPAREQKREHTA